MKQVEERYISLLTDFGFKRILEQTSKIPLIPPSGKESQKAWRKA